MIGRLCARSGRVRSLVLAALLPLISVQGREYRIVAPSEDPRIAYGLRRLELAMQSQGDSLLRVAGAPAESTPALRVVVDPGATYGVGDEGFWLHRLRYGRQLDAEEARGAMYGLLHLAEQVRQSTPLDQVPDAEVRARFGFRAIKYNLPWAAYRTSFAIEQHQETCKDLKYWEAFLDMMAENRFNVLSLWSLHPYHYMVRAKNFPDACPFNDVELAEWQTLWRGIFALAKERGIETYLLNWNIFVSPEFARAHDVARWSETWGHFGDGNDSELVKRYTRETLTQLLDEYPDLTGLGITLGERMGGMDPDQRRAWLDDTFFAGIAAASRPAKFIYRAPLSADSKSGGTTSEENDRRTRAQIERLTNNITGPVHVEFKHNWSHAHSSPDLFIVHGGKLSDAYWDPAPTRHQVVWTMRNEDLFILRWGQPDFVRQFIQVQDDRDYVGGVIVGSECYLPALDYITKAGPHKTWDYAFQRQWLFYQVWGRLLYDPSTPDSVFERALDSRFGKGRGTELLAAWKLASRVPLHFASFYQGRADGTLYTEGHSTWRDNRERTYIDVEKLISHPVLDSKRYVNIADHVKADGRVERGVFNPLTLADQLDRDCGRALKIVRSLRKQRNLTPTLDCELTDIEAWCAYGAFFAEKLRGGTALARARAMNDRKEQAKAVESLERAAEHWKQLAALGAKFNTLPVPSNSKEPFSWEQLTPAVEQDIATARKPLSSNPSMP